MLVILQKDVKGTGKAGDVVDVNPGFARNMLFPRGLAKQATDGNMKNIEKYKEHLAEKEAAAKTAAEEKAAAMAEMTVEIKSKGGDGGRLFGSITSQDIVDAIKEQHNVTIDKKKVVLKTSIKTSGEAEVPVKLYQDVIANLKVNIVIENA
ncbi:MAG: 50S ribosomal protein L9 [Anaerovoracaceae bacterium]